MLRDWRPFLEDIVRACERVTRYVMGLSFDAFVRDERTYDAVLRNLTIIGEAAKQIPEFDRANWPDVDRRNISRFRDIAVHHYFALDDRLVWDIAANKVPELLAQLRKQDPPLPS
jgi:uncharacterized protein with HEPN domain